MSYRFFTQAIWARETNRMLSHAMYRGHIGNEQDVEMLRALNDYYDLQTPHLALSQIAPSPDRSPTPSPIVTSVSPEPPPAPSVSPPVSAISPSLLQFTPIQTPSLMRDVLDRPQMPSWLPDASTAAAFVLLCDERTVIGTTDANARIEALYLLCAGETVVCAMQNSGFSYQCLRSMCLTLSKTGAEAYLQHLLRRY